MREVKSGAVLKWGCCKVGQDVMRCKMDARFRAGMTMQQFANVTPAASILAHKQGVHVFSYTSRGNATAVLGRASVVSIIDPRNRASVSVAQKLGMQPDGPVHRSDGAVRLVYRLEAGDLAPREG